MKYIFGIIISIAITIVVHITYIVKGNSFSIAFIGGGIAMLSINFFSNWAKKENRASIENLKENKKKNRKVYIILTVILIWLIASIPALLKSNYFRVKLASAVENVKFKNITQSMETTKYENITYYYSNAFDKTCLNKIGDYIKEGDTRTKPIFGQTSKQPLNMVVFTTSEEFGRTFKVDPEKSQAVTIFDSIYAPFDNINPHIFVHEYTHFIMNSFYKNNGIQLFDIPYWFSEGVAEYASLSLDSDYNKVKNAKLQNMTDFRNLDIHKDMTSYQSKDYDAYFQSYLAIKKIVELKGENVIQDILMNTKSMNFYDAFEKVVGLKIEDFQSLLK